MGKSEMESPLLSDDLGTESALRTSEEGRIPTESISEDAVGYNASSQSWSKGMMIGAVMFICCFAGVILLLSWTPYTRRNSRFQNEGGRITRGGDDLNYYAAQRTTFHFQPADNFMSDPCAPMYYKGYYHLFYQWNPYDRVWGNISWGHSVSTDLIHWQYLEPSLRADEWYDLQGAWSGYATTVDGSPVVLYTSGRGDFGPDANQSISMALPVDPSDPLLREWKKYDSNPILYSPPGFSSQAFRDPTTAWHEEDAPSLWRMSVPSVIQNADKSRDGVGLMYTSPDFYHWQLEETLLHRVHGTGTWECLDLYPILAENELGPDGKALDPEIYHDGMRYVLKAGMDETRIDYYAIGTYSTKTHTFTPDDPAIDVGLGHCYDYGWFYASKTFYDVSTRRRILWGFVHEEDSQEDDKFKGWSSLQAIPRTVWLDGKTRKNVLQWPVVELEALRGTLTSYRDIELQPADVIKVNGGDGQQEPKGYMLYSDTNLGVPHGKYYTLDILVAFEKPDLSTADLNTLEVSIESELSCRNGADNRGMFGPFGLIILADESRIEHSDIFFYIHRKADGHWGTLVCSDQSRSSVNMNLNKDAYGHYLEVVESDEELTLRVLVDHSIAETFVQGGRFAITARIYPMLALEYNARLFLFNNGTTAIKVKSLDVYQMGEVTMAKI